jgi:hypothetical protein
VSVSEYRVCCCVREDGGGELGRRWRWCSCCSCSSSCPPLRLHRCSFLVQTPGLQNLQVPSTFSCGTCFWGGFCSLGTCFFEIFRRPFPGVQVPIIGFSVPDLQNEVPCVCRSLPLCVSLSLRPSLARSPALRLLYFVQIFSHCLASNAKDFASQWTGFKQEKGSKEDSRFKLRREALYCILGTGKKESKQPSVGSSEETEIPIIKG